MRSGREKDREGKGKEIFLTRQIDYTIKKREGKKFSGKNGKGGPPNVSKKKKEGEGKVKTRRTPQKKKGGGVEGKGNGRLIWGL